MKIGMPHVTSIHEEILMRAFLTCRLGFGNVSGQFYHGGIHLDTQQLLIELLTKNGEDTLAQRDNRKIEQFGIIAVKRKCNIRVNQSNTFKLCKNIT